MVEAVTKQVKTLLDSHEEHGVNGSGDGTDWDQLAVGMWGRKFLSAV